MKRGETHDKLINYLHEAGFKVQYVVKPYDIFTIACAMATRDNPNIPYIESYGISRRSILDRPNQEIGDSIAIGRALKALILKYKGVKDLHHHSLFMG